MMRRHPPAWYDTQYNNRARIPEHPSILQHWYDESVRARAAHPEMVERAYGAGPTERLDVFPATRANAPVLVYIHGGYWRALGKRDQSFIAPPFVAAGAMVVLPGYALAPAVSVEHIVLQMVQALAWVWRHAAEFGGDPARIVVAGHSAGGQLAAMLLACDWRAVAPDLPADLVKAALPVSGLFDLEPLRHAPFLAPDLKLTAASAKRLSPALLPAPQGVLATVVGGDESEEFLRQSELIARAWGPRTVIGAERVPNCNHMSVLQQLADPVSATHRLALRLLGL
jgi:arylformamidase